jgi:hypothetical protein
MFGNVFPTNLATNYQHAGLQLKFLTGEIHLKKDRVDPEGIKRYSSTLSLTPALGVCDWLAPRPGRFITGNDTRYELCRRLGGSPGPVWKLAENPAATGIGSPDRPARSELRGCANPTHDKCSRL